MYHRIEWDISSKPLNISKMYLLFIKNILTDDKFIQLYLIQLTQAFPYTKI